MEHALSLKTGEIVAAESSNYSSSKNLLLVCPECGEPVHYKLREIPQKTPFFSHPKEIDSIKLIKQCSLRIDGGEYKLASSVVTGISHGQLVDRFQREFCKTIYESLGPHTSILTDFLRESRFLNLESSEYLHLIRTIEDRAPFNEVLKSEHPPREQQTFQEGIHDVCLFLRSPHGTWAGNFIYQTAYFIACITHPDTLNRKLGRTIHETKKTKAIFIAEGYRVRQWKIFASEILSAGSKRNLAIPQIAATLVAYLLLSWRFRPDTPKLLAVATDSFQPLKSKTIDKMVASQASAKPVSFEITSQNKNNTNQPSTDTGSKDKTGTPTAGKWWDAFRSNANPLNPINPPQSTSRYQAKKSRTTSNLPSNNNSTAASRKGKDDAEDWWLKYVDDYTNLSHQSEESRPYPPLPEQESSQSKITDITPPSNLSFKEHQRSVAATQTSAQHTINSISFTNKVPTNIGRISRGSAKEIADLEARLTRRLRSIENQIAAPSDRWIYFSDLDSIINAQTLLYVQRESFKMGNKSFTLATTEGEQSIPYHNVLWR